jgi:signal recognition particle receptor subunit beta
MQFSSSDKSLYLKIVYYGPGLSGKTTNLETIHKLTDPRRRQAMVSLKTEGDRTLFFDLLPFDLGRLYGMDIRIKLYTVPGQIQYDTTRKQVLAGADGVVFVADSDPKQRESNKVMVRYLRSNLQANGLDPEKIPLVFQWNKRDLAAVMPVEEMKADLDWRGVSCVPAVATGGPGVMETFREITIATVESLSKRAPSLADRVRENEVRGKLETVFAEFIEAGKRGGAFPAATTAIGRTVAPPGRSGAGTADGAAHFGLDDLLSEAVETNLSLSERLVADASREQLIARVSRERKALLGLSRLALGASDREGVMRLALRAALGGLELTTGSILRAAGASAPLKEVAASGRPRDPLNAVLAPGIGSVATSIMERGQPVMSRDPVGELLFGTPHPALEGLRGLLAIPIQPGRGGDGLLVLYADANTRDLDGEDLEFASAVACVTALALRSVPAAVPA